MNLNSDNSPSHPLAQFLHQLESAYWGTPAIPLPPVVRRPRLHALVNQLDPNLDRQMREALDWSWFALSQLDQWPDSPQALLRALCACDRLWRLWIHDILPRLAQAQIGENGCQASAAG